MKVASTFLLAASILSLALIGCARPDPNSPSGKRHAAFEDVGDATKKLNELFKEGAKPDLDAAAAPIAALKAQAAILPGLFPAGSGPDSDQPTEALAIIWTKPDEFKQEMSAFTNAVAALDMAVTNGDTASAGTTMGDLGKSCKSCHSKFREE